MNLVYNFLFKINAFIFDKYSLTHKLTYITVEFYELKNLIIHKYISTYILRTYYYNALLCVKNMHHLYIVSKLLTIIINKTTNSIK